MDEQRISNDLSGTVHGAAVQAGSISGGVHFHLSPPAAEPAPHPAAPAGWGQAAALPADVQALLRAQAQAAQELPYRLPGARRPALATLYVRQELGSGQDDDQPEPERPAPIVDDRGRLVQPATAPVSRLVVRPPSRSVHDVLASDDHVVVTGGPGQGKSTLSLRLAAELAGWWSPGQEGQAGSLEPVLPLRVTARELAARLDTPFPHAIAASVRAEYGALLGKPVDADRLGERVAGRRWLLLVDGLDEVADAVERDRLVTVLAAWASTAEAPYRIVLTTRPIEGAALAPLQHIGANRYELQPFDETALRDFAGRWFDLGEDADRFVRQIRAAHLDELVRVPLLATIAAIIFEQHGDRPLPDSQYELYESYLKYLRSAQATRPGRFDEVCGLLLEHLGRVRLEADTSLADAATAWAGEHVPGWTPDAREELISSLTAAGPLVRRGGDLRFLHHSFAEHLAATAQARLLPAHFDHAHPGFALLLHTASGEFRGRHARAVLLHYTRLHPAEADRLITWLHAGNADEHLLAARLLAWRVPAGAGVVDDFLATVRAWARTTQSPGDEILAQAGRATHHPGIGGWLSGLMDDEAFPWPSRVAAATALATRLRGAEGDAARHRLREVIDQEAIAVEVRLAAAEALSDCGGDDRAIAEHGLVSVLGDQRASALERRKVAVVLSAFGSAARARAVRALESVLADPWAPDRDLVEAATGLVEIGVEFHERCADAFRAILGRHTGLNTDLTDAARALASLGAPHFDEAVAVLTGRIEDRRNDRIERIFAVEALAELGPQHRAHAVTLLQRIGAEFDVRPLERRFLADSLANLGFPEEAVERLRAVLADRMATVNHKLWAARSLGDAAPQHGEEAAALLQRLVAHPLAPGYERTAALGWLAAAGEPHRSAAVDDLRDLLADTAADPRLRREAATQLARLGPEFHPEIVERLGEIARRRRDPDLRSDAWRLLRRLDGPAAERAAAELVHLLGPDEAATWVAWRDFPVPQVSDTDDHEALARAVIRVLRDPARRGDARRSAATTLVTLGRPYHRDALDRVIALLRSRTVPDAELPWLARSLTGMGHAPRDEAAEVFRELLRGPAVTAGIVCGVAEALDHLGHRGDPEVVAALERIAFDETADGDSRGEAAVALARAAPDRLGAATAVVLSSRRGSDYRWETRLRALAALGADLVPGLRDVTAGSATKRIRREIAAALLAELDPGLREEALAELESQAADDCLVFSDRVDVWMRIVALAPDRQEAAIAFVRRVLEDERQSTTDRCEAAKNLAQLDDSLAGRSLTVLRRLAADQERAAHEHELAVYWWDGLSQDRTDGLRQANLLRARDPAATVWFRARLAQRYRGREARETRLALLDDPAVAPGDRFAGLTAWDDPDLIAAAESALADLLTAPEVLPAERVEAAVTLAGLSPRHLPRAVGVLAEFTEERFGRLAWDKLAELDPEWRRRRIAEARAVLADESRPWRDHAEASEVLVDLVSAEAVAGYLRGMLDDPVVGDLDRVEIRVLLRDLDGLGALRRIRDDDRAPAATRWTVANRLAGFTVADRAAGVRTLHALATDRACRPTLRWRAGRDLMSFGDRGRELGAPALHGIVTDATLPQLVRTDAARTLAGHRPDLRGEMLGFLQRLRHTGKPLARVQVCEAIGHFDSLDGALGLRALAADRSLGPRVRLRAATAMANLRADHREQAALVAREVAHDEAAPRHVRVKAARLLARLSRLCRGEARDLLRRLTHVAGNTTHPFA
ncbi:NACHT domain-containing protein [Amycolatopsis thermoflava]|uniref:NACHT domain-containing protein n=1 Tax=Amycolatopsis thermoflava TaxID=84480 RepID=UPI003666A576